MYFAYGSNINLDQMAYRCPAAQVVGPVVLEGYELLFRGNASGNGVATIKPKEGQQVHGLLWRITPGCERSLDLYEGYPHLYEKESVAVRDHAGRQLTVMAYDIICGTFFIAGLGQEDFVSLTDEQIQRYKSLYDNMQILPVRTAAGEQGRIVGDQHIKKKGKIDHER